jgi:hypothetical protein
MSASIARKDGTSTSMRRNKVTESASRPDSEAGGVPLPQNDEQPSFTKTSSKRKRRPRKLPNEANEVNEANEAVGAAQAPGPKAQRLASKDVTISAEVEALKSKVKEIEAQLQEILLRPTAPQGPTKSARRRARQQKGQPTTSGDVEQEDSTIALSKEQIDLHRLQEELQEAQGELSSLKAKKSSASEADDPRRDEEDIEDIPRLQGPGLEVTRPRPLGRAVTLSGSYRIPVPVGVSDADLNAISKGISSAQNIARSFIDSDATRRKDRPAPEPSSGSWSEWFGGYSMSIAKAVDSMRITSNIETVPKRPAIRQRSETAPPRRKPQKLELRGKKRPDMPNTKQRLSERQVAGLLA